MKEFYILKIFTKSWWALQDRIVALILFSGQIWGRRCETAKTSRK